MKLRSIEKKSKRGQEITLGTIILIVLGIAVLVFLIWGFSTGWSNFWGKISAMFGGGANVDSVKLACNTDCRPGNEQAYCVSKKTLKYEDASGKLQKASESCDSIRQGQYNNIVGLEPCNEIPHPTCETLNTNLASITTTTTTTATSTA